MNVLIVDDHAGFRARARALLDAEGLNVVGEAADVESALDAVERLRPGVVLLDVCLPGRDGIEGAALMAASEQPPAVILMSSREAGDFAGRLAGAAARGFLAKGDLCARSIQDLLA